MHEHCTSNITTIVQIQTSSKQTQTKNINSNPQKQLPPKQPETSTPNKIPNKKITNETNFRYSKIIIMQLTPEVQLLKGRRIQTRGERLHAGGTNIVGCNK